MRSQSTSFNLSPLRRIHNTAACYGFHSICPAN
jgi:hypothetical protein